MLNDDEILKRAEEIRVRRHREMPAAGYSAPNAQDKEVSLSGPPFAHSFLKGEAASLRERANKIDKLASIFEASEKLTGQSQIDVLFASRTR